MVNSSLNTKSDMTDITATDWIKLLNQYNQNQNAYTEKMNVIDDLNPIVFVWSEVAQMPMPNPMVTPNDLEVWNAAKNEAEKKYSEIVQFRKTLQTTYGRTVTAETLRKLAPPGVTDSALASALGVDSSGNINGSDTFERMMAKRLYLLHRQLFKSYVAGLTALSKKMPMAGEHSGEGEGTFGMKGGMRLRWDAAHNYVKPVIVQGELGDLSKEDRFAIRSANRISGMKTQQVESGADGSKRWRVHMFLRPHQERFYQEGMKEYVAKHGPEKASKRINKIENERRKIVKGEWKPLKLTDRYSADKVQQGTIAHKKIAEGSNDGDNADAGKAGVSSEKQLVPNEGTHGPVATDQHDSEMGRGNVPRASQGAVTGKVKRMDMPAVAGAVTHTKLFAAVSSAKGRADPALRGMNARRAREMNGGRLPEAGWRNVFREAKSGTVQGPDGPIKLTSRDRKNWDAAAARMAIDSSKIRSKEEWTSLSDSEKDVYRLKIIQHLHQNANPERYGTAKDRAAAQQRNAVEGEAGIRERALNRAKVKRERRSGGPRSTPTYNVRDLRAMREQDNDREGKVDIAGRLRPEWAGSPDREGPAAENRDRSVRRREANASEGRSIPNIPDWWTKQNNVAQFLTSGERRRMAKIAGQRGGNSPQLAAYMAKLKPQVEQRMQQAGVKVAGNIRRAKEKKERNAPVADPYLRTLNRSLKILGNGLKKAEFEQSNRESRQARRARAGRVVSGGSLRRQRDVEQSRINRERDGVEEKRIARMGQRDVVSKLNRLSGRK